MNLGSEILDRVAGDAEVKRLAAGLGRQGAQAGGVAVVDLPRRRLLARLEQLVAGREDGDDGAAIDLDGGAAD